MPYISDIEQLGYLSPIARKFGVRFRLKGGVAFRLASEPMGADRRPLDLFQLVPFSSDVDLLHTGPATLTTALLRAIVDEVPDAECFRWELRSEKDQVAIDSSSGSVGVVPARTISIIDEPGVTAVDTAGGLNDIRSKKFQYHLNPSYKSSAAYRSGRDIPVFSALLYLQTLFEAGIGYNQFSNQPGWAQAIVAAHTCEDEDALRQLEEHAYLRARFWYLMLNTYAAAPSSSEFGLAADSLGLKNVVKSSVLPGSLSALEPVISGSSPSGILTSSSHLRGDAFRFDRTPPMAPTDPASQPSMAAGQSVLFVSPALQMKSGTALSVGTTTTGSEFVHLVLPASARIACAQIQDDANLSAIVQFANSVLNASWLSVVLPCIFLRKVSDDRILLRINLFGLPAAMLASGRQWARICIVGRASGESG